MQFEVVRQDFHRESLDFFSGGIIPFILLQILFLNKIDLFAEKLPRSPLGDYFPDFTGGDNYEAACEYLLHRYVLFPHLSLYIYIIAYNTLM